jgi:dimethylglycine catabolism A
MTTAFPLLFSPIKLGHRVARNRIVSTPHDTNYATDGLPNDRLIAYHAEKVKGGCGTVMMFGSASVSPLKPARDDHENLWKPEIEPWLRRMADAIHAHGALCLSQMLFGGRHGTSLRTDNPGRGPSATTCEIYNQVPHVMRRDEIEEVIQAYAVCAGRLKDCGFDGCDLAFYDDIFPDQFWNPKVNRRTDDYSGSLDNRMRVSLEILQAIRARVGRDFIVGVRISGDDHDPDGLDHLSLKEIGRRLNVTGLVDYFTITGGTILSYRARGINIPSAYHGKNVFVALAASMREVISAPIIAGGRVIHPAWAEELLRSGAVDLVPMTRALMADPDLPRKAAAGEIADIRRCMGSNEGCIDRDYFGLPIACIQNPAMGREAELATVHAAEQPKRVVVIGGGPGGMEAARVAAVRGHRVTLFEQEAELGGQILIAARAPHRAEYVGSVAWLAQQLGKTDVEVRLGARATVESVLHEQPDAVVVATGARPRRPGIPGDALPHVTTVREVLAGRFTASGRCLIYDEIGHLPGPTTADFLAEHDLPVEIVSRQYAVGEDIGTTVRATLTSRLLKAGVVLTPMTALEEIARGQVRLRNVYSDEERWVPADTVVLSSGGIGDDDLYYDLRDRVPEAYLIGDALAPRRLSDALMEATQAARKI